MAKILAMDTSSYKLGVAVSDGDTVIGEYMTQLKKNHALRLMPAVESLLQEVGIKPADLDVIAVAKGPGSYTGVRMATTAAKTLAWTLGLPLVAISTIELMAQAGTYFHGYVVPIIDARRQTVFTGAYRSGGARDITMELPDRHSSLTDWLSDLQTLDGPFLFVGEDARLHREAIVAALGEQAVFAPRMLADARPGELCALASKREPIQHVHAFEPMYLRQAEAEVNWQRAQKDRHEGLY
ncbi:tRNA (adenosine(37)-N6)-threonylcarbamoyltransferase complex dimerization subunit type 1 TsaB [Shouchella clausii]|uniref:tRNA (Adenosine(37)-N6)-threonylcarbamoyltransferase complex dimerization subunit type 1 TsaB n=1 Tax=Shouchella clausii TaxID=79880 RepID=A0A268RWH7_SHOCL|nr:tRNA (adenosine(37)-N6)-threonylcarbamoyltransferase complex dimerization subunit type 1 TsaB [Shouchella clausii]PAD41629.1 tRNA (adenosine(37)-N6)-threonylcarbamoyltransferase complex dimerization subunit type 1 TsaB [Bacillus sp. 7520-S]AST94812.1 tRNA (adenosine(37)-N6)-threonylcarbamoyltransferase complex dimerization subunit type 1 TsaB [Shouchella clausii]MBU8597837.1 tRNA (adenosine(37)-N6)-threonylcarbamoyltransferase complex dimerization subunit type 1 TsaB [Shouchella clausii]MCY1